MVMRRGATKKQINPNVVSIKQSQMNTMHRTPQSESKLLHHWGKYLLIFIIIGCQFLPYQYETGGNAEVFPSARVSVTADIEGIIEEVYFKGGERVQPGTVLARIADYNQINQLHILDAEIEGKKYEIERYRSTPSVEDIKLAEKKISTARIHTQYSQEKLKKQESLFEKGFISLQAFEDARVAAERDEQLLDEAIASMKALKAQINPFQIKTLKTELEKLQRQASYHREKLRRTNLVTPIGGRIVTTDLQYQRSSYLEAGKKFADIEDTDTVIVRAAIPESDLFEISDKALLTLKLYAYPNRKFEGIVDEIEVIANTADYGRVVYVRGHISNPDGAIKTGLTGYAKIQGNETIVLFAFTRALIRFVTIEIWSWLP
jgi:putative peptide zinc metalloprotease protein